MVPYGLLCGFVWFIILNTIVCFILSMSALGSNLSTIKIKHGGKFVENGDMEKKYIGGVVDFIDGLHVDRFSLEDLDYAFKY